MAGKLCWEREERKRLTKDEYEIKKSKEKTERQIDGDEYRTVKKKELQPSTSLTEKKIIYCERNDWKEKKTKKLSMREKWRERVKRQIDRDEYRSGTERERN